MGDTYDPELYDLFNPLDAGDSDIAFYRKMAGETGAAVDETQEAKSAAVLDTAAVRRERQRRLRARDAKKAARGSKPPAPSAPAPEPAPPPEQKRGERPRKKRKRLSPWKF